MYLVSKIAIGLILLSSTFLAEAQTAREQIAMRLIGHEILLAAGDSTSRISSVEWIDYRYKITFETAFDFSPETLVPIVERIMHRHKIANSYIVELQACDTTQVVYSYEIAEAIADSMIPCSGRAYPESCYELYVTLPHQEMVVLSEKSNMQTAYLRYGMGIVFVITLGLVLILKQKATLDKVDNHHLLPIGRYRFDQKNNQLLLNEESIELTHKEAALLWSLYAAANEVVTREQLLAKVWGDEGDYVGRTLDVFISKLRKKLSADDRLKIVNVRGVGYRLIVKD